MKVVGCHLNALAALTPSGQPSYSFLLEAESTPGPYVAGRCTRKSMKTPSDPIGNRSPKLPARNALPQPTTSPRTLFK